MSLAQPEIDQEVDLSLLEEIFNAPHCESKHEHPTNRVCTHTPIARTVATCNTAKPGGILACTNQVAFFQMAIDGGYKFYHDGCGALCAMCFVILPLD